MWEQGWISIDPPQSQIWIKSTEALGWLLSLESSSSIAWLQNMYRQNK